MLCAFATMLLVDLFALRVSSIMLMLAAAIVSLSVFLVGQAKGKEAAGS